MTRHLLAIVGFALLAGCATSTPAPKVITKIEVIKPTIPASLLDCEIPSPDSLVTNGDAQAYVIELHRQARACESRMGAIRGLVESWIGNLGSNQD